MCTSGKGIAAGEPETAKAVRWESAPSLRNSKRLMLLEWGFARERYPGKQSYTWMRRPSHLLCLAQGKASWRRWYVSSFVTTE